MSDAFSIGCKDCKKHLWIGQGWNKEDFHIYTAEKEIKDFKSFLWDHKGHHLIFDEKSNGETFDNYDEIE